MLMKETKFSKHKCYFLTFFCPADNPVAHSLHDITMQKAPG